MTVLTIAMNADGTRRLDALKAKTEVDSYAEVVRNALRLYEALIEETENGKQFLARDREGVVSHYRLFL
jgi:hypothetical protein